MTAPITLINVMAGLLLVWCKYALLTTEQKKNTDSSHDWLIQYILDFFCGISVALCGWYAKERAESLGLRASVLTVNLFAQLPWANVLQLRFRVTQSKPLACASHPHDYVASSAASRIYFAEQHRPAALRKRTAFKGGAHSWEFQ
jgi:hypothetical protein